MVSGTPGAEPRESPSGPPGSTSRGEPFDRPLTVLLVEDDDADAFLVSELLDGSGLVVDLERARNVDEALAVLSLAPVDCLLLDLGLPDAVGLSAVERVAALVETLPAPPAVVVLTGQPDLRTGIDVPTGADLGVSAVAAGADDYLLKGEVDGDSLARSLRYATLRRRSTAQQLALYRSEVRAAETTRLERALLPKELLRDDRISVQVGYLPGGNGLLGGDFFDTVEREDGTVFTVIGDVAGHGPDEAALGAAMRTAWRTLVLSGADQDEVLPLMERVLLPERGRPEVFVTLCQAVITPDRGSLDLYLAGHLPPLLVTGAGDTVRCEELSSVRRGRALGIPVSGGWTAHRIDLAEQWSAILYTDGLVEASVAVGEAGGAVAAEVDGPAGPDGCDGPEPRPARLGAGGLRAVVEAELADGTDGLVPRVLRRVRTLHGGPLADDAALLVIGWAGAGTTARGERTSTLADSAEWSRA